METVVIRLDPEVLTNLDADHRYVLPDLLNERSMGKPIDVGYDYLGDESYLVLFMKTADLQSVINCVADVVENVLVFENDFRPATIVAVKRQNGYEVVHPASFDGSFLSE